MVIYAPDILGLKEEMSGDIAGSLLGVSGLIAALGVERFIIRKDQESDKKSEVKKILYVIGTELANLAYGMMNFRKLLVAAITTKNAGGHLPEKEDLTSYMPSPMFFLDILGKNILLLNEKQVEVLFLLKSHLQLTSREMEQVSNGKLNFGLLTLQRLLSCVNKDMELLAEAFEKIVPDRKLQLPNQNLELASVLLGNLANAQVGNSSLPLNNGGCPS